MPEAETTNTRTPPDIVGEILRLVTAKGGGELRISVQQSLPERELLLACHSVLVRCDAMRLLTHAVADVQTSDRRHEASYAIVERLRPEWVAQLAMVAACPAQEARGIAPEATLFASLVEGTKADEVEEPPALRIAASLVNDLLVLDRS